MFEMDFLERVKKTQLWANFAIKRYHKLDQNTIIFEKVTKYFLYGGGNVPLNELFFEHFPLC